MYKAESHLGYSMSLVTLIASVFMLLGNTLVANAQVGQTQSLEELENRISDPNSSLDDRQLALRTLLESRSVAELNVLATRKQIAVRYAAIWEMVRRMCESALLESGDRVCRVGNLRIGRLVEQIRRDFRIESPDLWRAFLSAASYSAYDQFDFQEYWLEQGDKEEDFSYAKARMVGNTILTGNGDRLQWIDDSQNVGEYMATVITKEGRIHILFCEMSLDLVCFRIRDRTSNGVDSCWPTTIKTISPNQHVRSIEFFPVVNENQLFLFYVTPEAVGFAVLDIESGSTIGQFSSIRPVYSE